MTRDPRISTRTSRPSRLLLVGPLVIAVAIAATACGSGPTAQPAKDTAPVAEAPAAVEAPDVGTIVENPSGPRSALLDGAEFANAVDAAIDAHHSTVTAPPSALLDGAEFATAVEAAIAAHSADVGATD